MKMNKSIFLGLIVVAGIFLSLLQTGNSGIVSYTDNIYTNTHDDPFFKYTEIVYPASVIVVDIANATVNDTVKIGVAGETNQLNFGRLPLSATTMKIINVENNEGVKSKLTVSVLGDMKKFTKSENEEYMLSKGKNEIRVVCEPKTVGEYTGEIHVNIITPKSEMFTSLLNVM